MRIHPVAVVLCAALLAGCAPVGADPVPTSSAAGPTTDPTPMTTPGPTPTPMGPPAVTLSELVLSPEGIGVIRMGAAVPADAAVAQIDFNYCDINHPDSGHGGWVPNYPLAPDNGNYAFFLESAQASIDSPVIWIAVGSDEIRTAERFGIGSSIADLEAFYGSALKTVETPMAIAHVVQGTAGQLVFWGLNAVDSVEISAPRSEPVFNYTLMCN